MPISVKIKNGRGQMPWGWMGLLAYECPGQFFHTSTEGDFVIFSGINLPEKIEEVVSFLQKHPNVSGVVGIELESATKIDEVPANSQALYLKEYSEAKKNAERSASSQVATITNRIKLRYNHLLECFNEDISKNVKPFSSKYFFALEKLSINFCRMVNTYNNRGGGRPSWYISSVMLGDTSLESLMKVVQEEQKHSEDILCPTFTFKSNLNLPIEEHQSAIKKIEKDAILLARQLREELECATKITYGSGEKFGEFQIMLPNLIVPKEQQNLFLESIRVAFFTIGADVHYNMTEAAFVFKAKSDLVNIKEKESGYLTDDNEEVLLEKFTQKIIEEEKLASLETLCWNKVTNQKDEVVHRIRAFGTKNSTLFKPLAILKNGLERKGVSSSLLALEENPNGEPSSVMLRVTLRGKSS